MHELQMRCPAPLLAGELHRRKLRSDKYKPPAGRLLEFYESDSSVEANEDTDAEAGGDPGVGVAKSRCDNPPRKILYYCLNQSTLVIKQ
jgi:hypothetical protein